MKFYDQLANIPSFPIQAEGKGAEKKSLSVIYPYSSFEINFIDHIDRLSTVVPLN
jgi:hypothetical protein